MGNITFFHCQETRLSSNELQLYDQQHFSRLQKCRYRDDTCLNEDSEYAGAERPFGIFYLHAIQAIVKSAILFSCVPTGLTLCLLAELPPDIYKNATGEKHSRRSDGKKSSSK